MTYLAVPIAAQNLDQAKQQIKAASAAGSEILELRTDYLENLTVDLVKKLIAAAGKAPNPSLPLIVTCRDQKQGGVKAYPEQLRIDVLTEAVRAGCDFIDCEYENFRSSEVQEKIKTALAGSSKTRLILSAHDFKSRFEDINKHYHDILAVCPTAIPKLIYTANNINDCFEAFDLLHKTSGDVVVFCMGAGGLISRIIAKKLGSFVTFASINVEAATAPGQLTIEQLKGLYRYDSIDTDAELFGVIADPVGHSLSPAIHNACFGDKGMNKLYLPLLVEGGTKAFDEFLNNILMREWLNFKGFSVTIPHKQNALNFVKAKQGIIESLAEKIGAVNTLIIGTDGKPAAYNTDYAAALDAITTTMGITRPDLKGLPVTVIGAGGVARAIVAGLSDAGATIKIYNRTVKKAENLAAEFNCDFAGLDDLPKVEAKLLINCTSIGMYPNIDQTPLPKAYIKKDMVVFDTVYNPADTLLLKQVKEAGAKTIDGISMFVNQGLAQFKLFTGQDGSAELMRKTISNCSSKTMRYVTKKLIIDKNVFGWTSISKIEQFVQNHFLILPDVLYYECVTDDDRREELLDRFRKIILAGGCICPGRNAIIQKEAEHLSPYGPLVDIQEIPAVRQTFRKNTRPYNSKDVETAYKNELKLAQQIITLADGFTEKLISEDSELLAEVRKLDSSKKIRPERLKRWAEAVDSQDINNASEKLLKGITKFPEKYCLSDEWVIWHFLRLTLILSMERTFLRHKGDTSGLIPIEHDIQDITYVLLLSRADGLLTRDCGCTCLAKAAFPEKDVFSSLDEVPDEYLCNWN